MVCVRVCLFVYIVKYHISAQYDPVVPISLTYSHFLAPMYVGVYHSIACIRAVLSV